MHKARAVSERYRLVSESSSYLYFRETTCKSGNDNNRKSKSYYNEIVATVDVKNQIVKHLVNCQGIRSICWLLYFQMERSIYLH